nr:MAG TPA: hypothetical protein [Caudoviricetes sp.]
MRSNTSRKDPSCSPRPSSPSLVSLSSLFLPCSTTHACSAEKRTFNFEGSKGHIPFRQLSTYIPYVVYRL